MRGLFFESAELVSTRSSPQYSLLQSLQDLPHRATPDFSNDAPFDHRLLQVLSGKPRHSTGIL